MPAATLLAQSTYAQATASAVMPGPATPGTMRSHAWMLNVPFTSPALSHGPGAANCLSGCYYDPADVNSIYAIASIAHGNGGAGVTVGIVDAYYNPQTQADLNAEIAAWGLAACPSSTTPPTALVPATIATGCTLTIVDQTGCVIGSGSCTLPAPGLNASWAAETDLDVQIVHSIAPNAKIILVACNNNSYLNLGAGDVIAETYANVVTNSFGGGESSGQAAALDPIFGLTTTTVPVLFSAGDVGAVTEYPCVSQYSLCVGGTSMLSNVIGGSAFRAIEAAWGNNSFSGNALPNGGGGGCSSDVSARSFEITFTTCGTQRGAPDISALADEYTGFTIFLGTNAGGGGGCCYIYGGTSLASPLFAGVIANIDADRVYNGKSVLGANLVKLLYQANGAGPAVSHYRFYDVTQGSTGFSTTTNWDEATGLGVVLGPSLATYLLTTP